jgi:hypothetical protein
MRYNIIKTENYLLLIDDSEIKEGDITLWDNMFIEKVEKIGNGYFSTNGGVRNPSLKTSKKIIAHLPLNNSPILQGVDLLPPLKQEDDVNKLAENEYREYPNNPKDKPDWHYNKDVNCHKKRKAFIKGYNKSRETYNYTKEDLIKAIEMARKYPSDVAGFELNEIIQFISEKNYPVSFECEMIPKKEGTIMQIPPCKHCIKPKTTTNLQEKIVWIGKYIY